MIEFNQPPCSKRYLEFIEAAVERGHICGDGFFTKKCTEWIENLTNTGKCLFTTSCTHSLEMAAVLADIGEGDEVILPSYTFASTADAFALRGAKLVFIDIRPDTMNINEKLIETAITRKTKAIVVVHYAGVSCEMDTIMEIARRYKLYVIEDAAQGMMSKYKGRPLGTIGDFGCYSFHETKNYSMGEGGAILLKDSGYREQAEILREKGTNRSKFWRGEIDKYSWVGIGSSYLPSELNMAFLWAQLLEAESINSYRLILWNAYKELLSELFEKGIIESQYIPDNCIHNAHMFFIKVKDERERIELLDYLRNKEIHAVFHYIPLHTAPSGLKYGRFHGKDIYTTKESLRIVRLPIYKDLRIEQVEYICKTIINFYACKRTCENHKRKE